jgi:protein TonB
MKVPYSYRHQFFAPVLITSFLGHALVFATGAGLLSLNPEYGVEQAPSSMEVVISKVETQKEPEVTPSKVLTTLSSSEKAVPVKKMKKTEEKKKVSKPVHVPPVRGASRHKASPYLKNPAPLYPQLARENGWEGLVMLHVFVQSDGKPGHVNVEKSSGRKILDDAAVKAVKQWQFKPAGIGNVSFSTWVRIPVRFTLVDKNEISSIPG